MEIKLSRKYFIGKSKPGRWSSVYAYKPHNEEIFNKRAEIFAVTSLKGPKDFDVATAGNLLLDHFHETYFENSKDTVLIALEKAVLSTQKRLLTLIENNVAAAQEGVEVDLISMVIKKDIVYFVNMGGGRVYVFRGGNLIDLTAYLKDPTGEGLLKVGSGKAEEGDKFLLLTAQAIEEYTDEELVDGLSKFSETELKNKLLEDESKVGLIMIKVGEGADEELMEEEEIEIPVIETNTHPMTKHEKVGMEEEKEMEEEIKDEMEEIGMPQRDDDMGEEQHMDDEDMEDHKSHDNHEPKAATEMTLAQGIMSKAKIIGAKIVEKAKSIKDKISDKSKTAGMVPPNEPKDPSEFSHRNKPLVTHNDSDPTYLYILKNVVTKAQDIFFKVKEVVWHKWLGMGSDKLFLKGNGARKNWKAILFLVVVVGAILYFVIQGQIEQANQKKHLQEAQALIDSSTQILNEVDDRITVALNSPVDEQTHDSLNAQLDDAQKKIDEAAGFGVLQDQIDKQKSDIESWRNKLNRIIKVDPEEVVDLAEHFEDVNIYDFDLSSDSIYISDNKRNVIYKEALTGGNPAEFISSGSNIVGPKSISVNASGELIVNDSSTDKTIATVNLTDKSVTKHTGLSPSKVGNLAQIETYKVNDSDRIYAVRPENKDVIYMEKSGSGYSTPLSRGKSEDFASALDVAVDGRVYILSKGIGLTRYLGTKVDPVSIQGLGADDSINACVAFDIDATRIFFADPDNRRILVFTKSRGDNAGIYDLIVQIKPENDSDFANLKEVVVDQKTNTLFALSGSKIFKISLAPIKDFEP